MDNVKFGKIALGIACAISFSTTLQTKVFAANGCPCFKQAEIVDACASGDKAARRLVRDLSKGQYALKIECSKNSYLVDRGFTYPVEAGEPKKAVCQISQVRWNGGSVVSTTGGPSSDLNDEQAQSCDDALEGALGELNLTAY